MALNPLYAIEQLPTTSQAAIREFNDRYLAAVGASVPNGWADTMGEMVPTSSPFVTFPVSQLRTLYKRTEGESRFKKLREASFDVKTEEFDDGYQARLLDLFLQVFAYRNWQRAPERLVLAEEQHRHLQVAALLDGTGTRGSGHQGGLDGTCVDGKAFFATDHPANITDANITSTYSNYQGTAKNVLGSAATGNVGTFQLDLLQAEVISMQTGVLDENGLPLGVDPDTILVPLDYYEALKNGLANSRILASVSANSGNELGAAAVDNIYKGKFNVIPVREFTMASTSTADWYLVDSKMIAKGVVPWVICRQTVPQSLALRVYDESSDFFKDTGDIKMSSHIWYGFALGLPHAIRRVKGPTR
jgi:hypothetical protein